MTGVELQVGGNIREFARGKISYEYDPVTWRLMRTFTSHNGTSYGYDERGRLDTVTATKLNGNTVNFDKTTYDNGAGTTDDVVHDYDYDTLNRLDFLTVRNGSGNLFTEDYVLEVDGQRDHVIERRYSSPTAFSETKIDWTYDALDRLTAEVRDVGNNGPDAADYKHAYAFDLAGNRLKKEVDEGNDGLNIDATTSTFNDRDQLLTATNDNGVTTYSYDANGSLIQRFLDGGTIELVRHQWDLRNRMVGYDANGDGDTADVGDATYGYDHKNNRVSKLVVGQAATYYLIDANNHTGYAKAIEEKATPTGTPTRSYVLGHDIVAQADGTSAAEYFLKDGRGATRALVDGAGVVQEQYDYDAFVNAIGFDASVQQGSIRSLPSRMVTWLQCIQDCQRGRLLHRD